jgi:alpha-D-xyloside xylohydrolase
MRKMLNLRYRLLPYIYSEAWQVSKGGSTMMRPMVMDFNGDTAAINHQYEYMFGKAILVAPVTEPNVKEWNVYLPKSSSWYDFWTGQHFNGGQTVKTDTPLDRIPLYIKAGSIIPLGKLIQYAGQKPADTLEIRVYKGMDGKFELYEDEGDNYNYENGSYTIIPFIWNEQQQTLTIGEKQGSFPGSLTKRVFNIIYAKDVKGVGLVDNATLKSVVYHGVKTIVK